jgi:hypothetical protein
MPNEYTMLIQDYDGHWYRIPVSQKENFEEWNEFCNNELSDYTGPQFDSYRSLHPCNYMFKEIHVLKEAKDV